ncbi:DUF1993 domain-containing protein [Parerythrobacter lacustris]|uniref:DUF1993 domain-containing protein n=1 Tax=Parerythrobacter lacustris TaxID=2969984 RepID=A0ABT1XUV4_9SPHN|nr:DUF1993 domain-containing protein [Parerythrobacter lacustris]MCR2834435.1 DUF1993 domain-containing protein [Parerythrobacter lacustris]
MSYATAALATYQNMLGTLDHLVGKASEHEKGVALLESRLAEDMYPLHTQIRFTIGQVIVALDRLGALGLESDDSDIVDFTDARARIARTKALVANTDVASWPASDATVEFDLPNGKAFEMQAHEYIRDWAMPQFYFHLMAAYAILRKEGLTIGKADYVPFMMKYLKSPANA